MEEGAKGTRTETSGGAGDHPHAPEAPGEQGDPKVDRLHDEATRAVREGNPPVRGDETSGTTSGG